MPLCARASLATCLALTPCAALGAEECSQGGIVLIRRSGQDIALRIQSDGRQDIRDAQELPLAPEASPDNRIIVTSDVLVGFDPSVGAQGAASSLQACGLAHARPLESPSGARIEGVYIAQMRSALDAVDAARRALHAPGVRWAAPDTRGPVRLRMNDPLFPDQWHLQNTGQGNGRDGADCEAALAWPIATGHDAVIGVVDDGFQVAHPDLSGAIGAVIVNQYFPIEGGGVGAHGTAVAGLIGARANDIGGVGVAPDATLLLSSLTGRSDSDLALDFAELEDRGAQVIACAWDRELWFDLPDVLATAIRQLSTSGRNGKGVLFVFPAAMQHSTVEWGGPLASMPETMCVGGFDNIGRWGGSAFGPSLDLVAPSSGGSLAFTTTDPTGIGGFSDGDYNDSFAGDSAAAAIAAGVAGLVFDANPQLHASQVRRILQRTARGYEESGTTIVVGANRPFDPLTRFSDTFGYGVIRAAGAVQAAQQSVGSNQTWPASATDPKIRATEGGIVLSWTNPPETQDGEYNQSLIARLDLDAEWFPSDHTAYQPGATPADGVLILARDAVSTLFISDEDSQEAAIYAVYSVNTAGRYSWPTLVLRPRPEPYAAYIDGFESANDLTSLWTNTGEWAQGLPNTVVVNTAGASSQPDTPQPMPPSLVGFNTPVDGFSIAATDLDGFYNQRLQMHRTTSPEIDLSHPDITSASVSYWELRDIEGQGQDMGLVQVLDADDPLEPAIRTLEGEAQSIALRWRQRWFDLTDFIGGKIKLRWTLEIDTSDALDVPGQHGWMLDLIIVRVDCPSGDCVPDTPGGPQTPPNEEPPTPIPGGPDGTIRPPRRIVVPDDIAFAMLAQRADIDRSGAVDALDLSILLSAFGAQWSDASYAARADLDESGRVDASDLFILLTVLSSR